jgi:hypothetical protein
MKSLIFQGATSFTLPEDCTLLRRRTSVSYTYEQDQRRYTFTLRDKVAPEDTVVMMSKAIAFAIMENEPFAAKPVPRAIRDALIKDNVVI